MIKTAFIWHRFGPYHHARLRAVQRDLEVVGIELSAKDETYAWNQEAASQTFRQVTLFRERDVVHEKTTEVMQRVQAALDDIQPDVVAICGWTDRGALAALAWCTRRRVPVIMMTESSHLDGPRVWWKEWLKRRVVRLCQSGLVGGTPHRDYVARLGMAPAQIFLGYDAIDNDHFGRGADQARARGVGLRQQLGLPGHYFLASSRFIAKKNLPTLLRAFARYRSLAEQPPWHLVLLGDGAQRGELERLCEALHVREAVLMPGFKQYQELPAYYGLAEAFVHASTVEQWGLVVNEAMAARLPVLVSRNCGCAADLVLNDTNGWVFDPGDVEPLAGLLAKMAALPEGVLRTMGEASRQIVARWGPAAFEENAVHAAQAALRVPVPGARIHERLVLRSLIHLGAYA